MQNFSTMAFLLMLSIAATSCNRETETCVVSRPWVFEGHLVDLSPFKEEKELMETIAKFPNLQVYRLEDDSISAYLACYVYYRGMIVVNERFFLSKSKRFGYFSTLGTPFFDTIPVSLEPKIDQVRAVSIVKHHFGRQHLCTKYRLGLYDINAGTSNQARDFRLVWEIQIASFYSSIVVDATTGEILQS